MSDCWLLRHDRATGEPRGSMQRDVANSRRAQTCPPASRDRSTAIMRRRRRRRRRNHEHGVRVGRLSAAPKPGPRRSLSGSRPERKRPKAPEPYGDTAARLSEVDDAVKSRSRGGRARERNGCANRIGWADCRWVLPGMMALGCAAACSASAPTVGHTGGDPAHRVAATSSRRAATWSLRGRPARSRPPRSGRPGDRAPLNGGMHVLVGDKRAEAAVGVLVAVQAGEQPVRVSFLDSPAETAPWCARDGGRRGQRPVEVGGLCSARPSDERRRGRRPWRPLVGLTFSVASGRRIAPWRCDSASARGRHAVPAGGERGDSRCT